MKSSLPVGVLLFLFIMISCKRQNEVKDIIPVPLSELRLDSVPFASFMTWTTVVPQRGMMAPRSIKDVRWLSVSLGSKDSVNGLFGLRNNKPVMVFDINQNGSLLDDPIYPKTEDVFIKTALKHPFAGDSFRYIRKVIPTMGGIEKIDRMKDTFFSVVHPYRYGKWDMDGNIYQFALHNFSEDRNQPYNRSIPSLVFSSADTPFPHPLNNPVVYKKGDILYLKYRKYTYEGSSVKGDTLFLSKNADDLAGKGIFPNQMALPVTGMDISGKNYQVNFSGKYTLLDFWGTWCGPCKQMTPDLLQLAKAYNPSFLQIVAIAADNDKNAVKEYVASNKIGWVNLIEDLNSDSKTVASEYIVRAFPTLILINPKGEIVLREVGEGSFGKVQKFLESIKWWHNPVKLPHISAGKRFDCIHSFLQA